MTEQGRGAVRRARGGEPGKLAVLVQRAAGHDGAERVEQHELRGGDGRGGKRVEARRGDERREPVQIVHGIGAAQATAPAMGGVGPRRGRYRP